MRIAAYCRVSTDKDEQLDSLNHQKEFFVEYAKRSDHELVRLYADEGISGTSLKKREEFKRLLRDAELGLFDMVVVKDISRFARNTVDALQSIRKLKSMGICTLFLTANMDSMGDSEFILTLFSAMAQEESSNLSKRVKWGKRINAEKGRVPQRIFGYDRIDNFTLEINPGEAGIVRKIFSLYNDQGLGCRTISATLNRDRDKTKLGSDWNARGVRRVLVNPIYCGILINHKYEIEDYLTGRQIRLPEEEQFCHSRPAWAIVTPEAFQKTQEIMASRRTQYDSGEPFMAGRYSVKHTFSTLIKCAHCGRSFTRKSYTYTNTRVYWRCVTNDQYTAEKCDNRTCLDEPELLKRLREYFASLIEDRDAFVADILTSLDKRLPASQNPEQAKREIEAKRKKLLSKKSRYQEMYASDILSLTELKEKITGITEELNALDSALARLAPGKKAVETVQRYTGEIQRFLELETVTNMDMRRILDHISVDREGHVRVILRKFDDAPA
jgi:resolvase domain protein (fragment)